MKKYIYIMSLAIGLIAASCRKEYKEIGENPSKIDGITASWSLHSCQVIDKAATVEETIDITPFFTRTTRLPNITFAMNGGTGTYTCDTSNVAYAFFGSTSGTWTFDNAEFPQKVMLTPAGATTALEFPLAATIRPTDTYLQIDKNVWCGGAIKSVYRLSFIRN
ncbi:MAG: DUF5004 domain-containing protein [Bacteroidota bacterium]